MTPYAELKDDELTLDTGAIRRVFAWDGGALRTLEISSGVAGRVSLGGAGPDLIFPGDGEPVGASLEVIERPESRLKEAHLEVTVAVDYSTLSVRRVFRLFEACPAIACEYYFRGALPGAPRAGRAEAENVANIEDASSVVRGEGSSIRLERLILPSIHARLEVVRFFDVTDRNNNLVRSVSVLPYRSPLRLIGNLLFARNLLAPGGIFLLKEAPGPVAHLDYPGYDFVVRGAEVEVVGVGPTSIDGDADEWVRGYGLVVGVHDGTDDGRLEALRSYQMRLRRIEVERDEMVLMNTWGDRGQDTRMREAFVLDELSAAARLGITHLQLDDGWQKGRSSNSAFEGGSLAAIWDDPSYWTPHPERFPRGLAPLVERAGELGIELCLWFNPSADESYAHWRDDADTLVGFYRKYGIRTFKIDGVMIDDKRGEINLRAMFDTVVRETDGEVVFNLDVTAGRRFGYFTFREYGNLFLENRYTDWSNYYPHWTLRNLWMLSKYIQPQSVQIEFLNVWRNRDRYPEGDALSPAAVGFEYCFAITMPAQPLAWFEGSGLPEEAFEAADIIRIYRRHQRRIHSGMIFPIGEEPTGTGWTGFQSIVDESSGYVLVFREYTRRKSAGLRLRRAEGAEVALTPVLGCGSALRAPSETIEFALPEPLSYALYAYRLNRRSAPSSPVRLAEA